MEKETQYRGYTITIAGENDPQSPRDWDNLGDMVAYHRQYTLGDHGHGHNRGERWDADTAKRYIVELGAKAGAKIEGYETGEYNDDDAMQAALEYLDKHGVVLPLYLYDHSGITISTGRFGADPAGWDTSMVGYIIATPEAIVREYKKNTKETREKARKVLLSEVATYDDYITGSVYQYLVEKDGEVVGACGGYFGYPDGYKDALEVAKSDADYHYNQAIKKHIAKKKAEIKNAAPLDKRTALQ